LQRQRLRRAAAHLFRWSSSQRLSCCLAWEQSYRGALLSSPHAFRVAL
jgi:hypothetical protein